MKSKTESNRSLRRSIVDREDDPLLQKVLRSTCGVRLSQAKLDTKHVKMPVHAEKTMQYDDNENELNLG